MKKSIKRELTKHLKESSKEELEKEIKKLYDKFKGVKEYYEMELSEDTTKLLNDYKEKLKREYLPKRGYGKARSSESRKIITAFKKIAVFKVDVIDLELWGVRMMILYTKTYGDMNEAFYCTLESRFEEVCALIEQENLTSKYKDECLDLIAEMNNFGWGVYGEFQTSYDSHFKK